MDPAVSLEIERKYDVVEGSAAPQVAGTHPITAQDAPAVAELRATYFDTDRGDLAAAKITLRQRVGGHDEGWHVKMPASMGRTELHWPLGEIGTQVPGVVADAVRVHIRDRDLNPIARLATHRSTHVLRGAGNVALAEFCDDEVSAENLRDGRRRQWREWEVELLPDAVAQGLDSETLLDAIERALTGAGALPARSVSKLARAMGNEFSGAAAGGAGGPDGPDGPDGSDGSDGTVAMVATETSTALQALRSILTGLVAALKVQDPRVRRDENDSVHSMRVVVRKLRSILRTYRAVLDRETVDSLRQRLRDFGTGLGAARDSEVRRDRALEHLEHAGTDIVAGLKRVADRFSLAYAQAHEQTAKILDSAEYFRLLDDLDLICRDPIPGKRALKDSRDELSRGIQLDLGRLKDTAAQSEQQEAKAGARLALRHEVRKAARRLRYSAEAANAFDPSAFGRKTLDLASLGHSIQSELGDQRDSELFAALLRAEAADSYPDERKALKRARAIEKDRSSSALAKYRESLRILARTKRHLDR